MTSKTSRQKFFYSLKLPAFTEMAMRKLVTRTFGRKRPVSIKYRIIDSFNFKEGMSNVRVSLKRKEC